MKLDKNHTTYTDQGVVDEYLGLNSLFPAEKEILNRHRSDLKHWEMLDIGIGAGRTTAHFAAHAKSYTGIDYSEKMITAAKKKYGMQFPVAELLTLDARDLSPFDNERFHFVLFSFNGIDYVEHKDRLQIFSEIKRVLKANGILLFSTHNLNSFPDLFKMQLGKNVLQWKSRYGRYKKLNRTYPDWKKLMEKDHTVIDDGAHGFGLDCYYIQPKAQLEQLQLIGFKDIEVISTDKGNTLKNGEILASKEPWLYYLCRK